MVLIYAIITLTLLLIIFSANILFQRYSNWEQQQDVNLKKNIDDSDDEEEEEEISPLLSIQMRRGKLPATMLWQTIPPKLDGSNVIRPRGLTKPYRKTSL